MRLDLLPEIFPSKTTWDIEFDGQKATVQNNCIHYKEKSFPSVTSFVQYVLNQNGNKSKVGSSQLLRVNIESQPYSLVSVRMNEVEHFKKLEKAKSKIEHEKNTSNVEDSKPCANEALQQQFKSLAVSDEKTALKEIQLKNSFAHYLQMIARKIDNISKLETVEVEQELLQFIPQHFYKQISELLQLSFLDVRLLINSQEIALTRKSEFEFATTTQIQKEDVIRVQLGTTINGLRIKGIYIDGCLQHTIGSTELLCLASIDGNKLQIILDE